MPTEAPTAESARTNRYRKWFQGIVILTVIWLVAFSTLVFLTANPVTLNWEQLQQSQTVVLAEVVDSGTGTVRVEKFWKNIPEVAVGEELTIDNLPQTMVDDGETYLLPLVLFEAGRGDQPDTFEIPLTQEQRIRLQTEQIDPVPVFYPGSEEAVEQLEKMLQESSERSGLGN